VYNHGKIILILFISGVSVFSAPKPFKCLGYAGYRDSQVPTQGEPSKAQVEEDIKILAPFTHGIRTYGSGRGTHGQFLQAICDAAGINLFLSVWINHNDAENTSAIDASMALVKEGHPSIKSVIVGNEYLLRSDQLYKANLNKPKTVLPA